MNKVLNHPFQLTTGLLILALCVVWITLRLHQHNIPLTPSVTTQATSSPDVTIDKPLSPANIIQAINTERTQQGLPPVTEDSLLNSSADRKAIELTQQGFATNPHINTQTGAHGYTYALQAAHCAYAAENISDGNNTTQSTVNAWINSPAHHAAMDGDYQTAGVGIEGAVVVLHLCRY